jgi:Flp pilus assembly protein TadD
MVSTPHPTLPPASRRRQSLLVVLALLTIVAGVIGATLAWRARSQTTPAPSHVRNVPPDPRLVYEGPFGNIRPDVAYVGDSACAVCHPKISASYHQHPMGRSLQPIASVADQEVYDRAHNNPFEALGTRFSIERSGSEVRHRAVFAEVHGEPPIAAELPVHFVIGSGTHGRSYLSNRNGYLFQTPISWFSDKQFWNLSPGFDAEILSGRLMDIACLFCHSNRAKPHEGTRNRFDAPIFQGDAIGCERCHGPGARHVETSHKRDIVNPRAKEDDRFVLRPRLRDAVCEQCHLEGEERVVRRGRDTFDFRPGLPLEEFWTVFVSVAENGEQRAVSHVEQMHQSRCYQRSSDDDKGGKLGCVSCHDPHVYVRPAEQARHYRVKCLGCHSCSAPKQKRLRRQPDDSCIACHMPRFGTSDIAHAAATDHRIPRRRGQQPKDEPRQPLADGWLMPFHQDGTASDRAELRRDLGIALLRSMAKRGASMAPRGLNPVTLLETALQNDPEDMEAWTSKATGLMASRQPDRGLAAFQSALQLQPQEESALFGAAKATQKLGRLEDSLDYWRRLIAVNPELPMYRAEYALLLEYAKHWDEARVQCRTWMRLAPNNVEARRLWISCLLEEGNKVEARKELTRLSALKPPNLGELRARFEKQLR